MQEYSGKWTVEADPMASLSTLLRYEITIVPKLSIPSALVSCIVKAGLPANIMALAKRAEQVRRRLDTLESCPISVMQAALSWALPTSEFWSSCASCLVAQSPCLSGCDTCCVGTELPSMQSSGSTLCLKYPSKPFRLALSGQCRLSAAYESRTCLQSSMSGPKIVCSNWFLKSTWY